MRGTPKYYTKVAEMLDRDFDPDVMTYSAFWRKRVWPVYPISYQTFLRIINMPKSKLPVAGEAPKRNDYKPRKNKR